MNPVQIHLMMNHVPVVAPVVAALLVLTGLAVKSQAVLRVGLAALVVAALFAVASQRSAGNLISNVVVGQGGTRSWKARPSLVSGPEGLRLESGRGAF